MAPDSGRATLRGWAARLAARLANDPTACLPVPDTIRRGLDRLAARLGTPAGAAAFAAASLFLLFAIRVWLFDGTGGDDAEQLVFSQSWERGYGIGNPPLYTWLVKLSIGLFGVSVLAVEAVKFALIGLTLWLLHRCARALGMAQAPACYAALAPLLLYYVTWDAVLGYSHSVLLMAVCLGAVVALLGLRDGGWVRYLLFGAVLGLGPLAKYSFGLFAAGLIGAALFDRRLRPAILSPRMLPALLLGAAIAAPHFLWVYDNREALAALAVDRFDTLAKPSPWFLAFDVTQQFVGAAISFLSPMIFLLLLAFPKAVTAPWKADEGGLLLLLRAFGLMAVLGIGGMVAMGGEQFRIHYMFVLIPVPLIVFLRLLGTPLPPGGSRFFAGSLTVVIALAAVTLGLKYATDATRGTKAYMNVPYAAIAAKLREAGFSEGTAMAHWYPYPLAGNLRPFLPKARLLTTKHPTYRPPTHPEGGSCLMVWNPLGRPGDETGPQYGLHLLLGEAPPATPPTVIRLPYAMSDGRMVETAFYLFPPDHAACAAIE